MRSSGRIWVFSSTQSTRAVPCSSQGLTATPNARRRWRCSNAAQGTGHTRRCLGLRHAGLRLGPAGDGGRPHIAQNEQGWRSAIDGRTTRHEGYAQSQRRRKRVEEVFGWIKTVGAGGKLRYLGWARNKLWFELTAAAYNLTRLANLEAAAA